MLACRAVMSFLQVVAEQHKLVQQHMDSFTVLPDEAALAHGGGCHGTPICHDEVRLA